MKEQEAIPTVVDELEQILAAQFQGHEQLLELVGRNREAVRRADMAEIKVVCELQNAVVQTVSELEKRRLSLVGSLTRQFAPDAGSPLTVSEIAAHLEPALAERLQARADALRPLVERVREESSVVRQAADALVRHMTGIVQGVHSILSQAQVYGRKGVITGGAEFRLCVDVRS